MFVSKLQGITLKDAQPSLQSATYQALAYELGGYTAQIHSIVGAEFGYFGSALQPMWKAAFVQMAANLLADCTAFGIGLPRPADEIQALIEQCAPVLDDIRESRLLHGDLWDANVFVVEREQGWVVEAIIDCDRALWGDPDAEYSLMFRDHQPRFFEGYGRRLSNTPDARRRRQLYLTYLYLIVTLETSVRHQEADRSGWADEQLRKALGELEQYTG
jgi:fructosamine-3-kinase